MVVCVCVCAHKLKLLSVVVKVVFMRWRSCGVHGECRARAYNRGLRVEPQWGFWTQLGSHCCPGAKLLVPGQEGKAAWKLVAF